MYYYATTGLNAIFYQCMQYSHFDLNCVWLIGFSEFPSTEMVIPIVWVAYKGQDDRITWFLLHVVTIQAGRMTRHLPSCFVCLLDWWYWLSVSSNKYVHSLDRTWGTTNVVDSLSDNPPCTDMYIINILVNWQYWQLRNEIWMITQCNLNSSYVQ